LSGAPELAGKSVRSSLPTQHRTIAQLFRYGLVGITTNLLGYFVYLFITHLGVEPKVLITFMYPIGAAIGFFGNRQWAFAHEGAVWKSGIRYCSTHLFGYLMNLAILFLFVDELGFPHQWVQAVAIILVAGYLFVAFKYFVFPPAEGCVRPHA
jgi:putative flippase GtrA